MSKWYWVNVTFEERDDKLKTHQELFKFGFKTYTKEFTKLAHDKLWEFCKDYHDKIFSYLQSGFSSKIEKATLETGGER